MPPPKMHDNELTISQSLVEKLITDQFPAWSTLTIQAINADGTDHAIFKLGEDKCIRLPKIESASVQVATEHTWLPRFDPYLPLDIPVPLGKGQPSQNYPWSWSIYPWLDGTPASQEPIHDLDTAAVSLAHFIQALQKIETNGGHSTYRGEPLVNRDSSVHNALEELQRDIDTKTALKAWQFCLSAQAWTKPGVWIHADLLPSNLIVQANKICGVIDFGMMGVGDPACDLLPAWALFDSSSREVFKKTIKVDEATWVRGQGWALSIGLIILPYYRDTNAELVRVGRFMVDNVLESLKNSKQI